MECLSGIESKKVLTVEVVCGAGEEDRQFSLPGKSVVGK